MAEVPINEKMKGNLEDSGDSLDPALNSDHGEKEEDNVIEIDINEAVKEVAMQWTGVARFHSVRPFSVKGLFDDMKRAWGIRQNLGVKVLQGNMFFFEFESEGDFKFVMREGPWLHEGHALIVAPYDGITWPSVVNLDTIPIWV